MRAAALLLLLAVGFMLPGLPPGAVAAPMGQVLMYPPWKAVFPAAHGVYGGGDLLLMQLPWHQWLQDELAAGRFPLWSSAPVGGMSMLGSYEVGAFYPLHLLWALLPTGAGMSLLWVLKLWLVGLGMWGFLRALRLHPAAALFSAVALMFSAWMVNLLPWQLTSVYLLLPWLAWAIDAWSRRGSRPALVAVAALVACAVFAGHPEMLFIMGLTLAGWAAGLLLTSPPRDWPRQAAGLIGAAALGFAIGAFQLAVFAESLLSSYIHNSRSGDPAGFAAGHLALDIMWYWVLPRHWGFPPDGILGRRTFLDGNAYIGLLPLLGIVLVAVAGARRQLAWRVAGIWTVIAVFAWLVCFDGTLGTAIRTLPPFNESDNARWLSILAFAGLVVAAYGWDWFARWVDGRSPAGRMGVRAGWAGAAGVLLVQGLVVLIIHGLELVPQPKPTQAFSIWWLVDDTYRAYWLVWQAAVAMAVLGGTALWAAGGRARRPAVALLVLLLVADQWRMMQLINPASPAEQYYPATSFIRQVQALVPPTERLVAQGEVLLPNSAMIYGIRDWRTADPMMTTRAFRAAQFLDPDFAISPWTRYNMLFMNVHLPVAPLLGIRYFILPADVNPNAPAAPDPDRPAFTRLAFKDGLGLWEATGVPGFAYLSDRVQVTAGEPAAAAWMAGATWAQTRSYPAVVEAAPAAVSAVQPGPAGESPGNVTVPQYTPGHIQVVTNATRPALLVVAESLAPGWRATLDGHPVDILRTNYLSQGVVVPAGTHTVELRYFPDSLLYGGLVSGAGLLGFVALIVWAWRRQPALVPALAPVDGAVGVGA